MSWAISKIVKVNDIGDGRQTPIIQLNEVLSDRDNIGNQQCIQERDEQLDAVLLAVTDLLVSAGFTLHADEISISLSGHANKDHDKDIEWANEFIQINIFTKKYVGEE